MSAWYWWTFGRVASNVRLAQRGRGRTSCPMGGTDVPTKELHLWFQDNGCVWRKGNGAFGRWRWRSYGMGVGG